MARPPSIRAALRALAPAVRRFAPHLKRERTLLAGGVGALLVEVGMRLLEPWPLKFLIDRMVPPGGIPSDAGGSALAATGAASAVTDPTAGLDPLTLILACAAAVVVLALGRAAAAYASTVAFALAGNRVLNRVRHELFVHLHRLQGRFYDRARRGDLVVRVIGDIGLLKDVMVTALLPLSANVLILVGMLGVMAWMDWRMTLLSLVFLPFMALQMANLGGRIRTVSARQRQREGALANTASESLGAMDTVQALLLESRFARAFADQGARDLKEGVRGKRLQARLERSVDVGVSFSTALVLGYGAHRMFAGFVSPGELVVFLAYLKNAFKPLKNAAKYTARIAKAAAAGERVLELLDEEPEVVERPDAVVAPTFSGDLRFDGVRFAYPGGPPVLDTLDLHVRPGERVALVGASGAGKSTLLSLLMRLRDPDAGRILVDGHDLREFTLESLRGQVAVLLQEPVLFAGTIRENIALGGDDVTDEQVEAAAQLACADGFIRAFPGGYEAAVGERGLTLSRGQRQRIAIARAAVRQAPFLILDEPTTGLDEENFRLVLTGLDRLSRGRTTLVVTHDSTLAERMDRIVQIGDPSTVDEEVPHALLA